MVWYTAIRDLSKFLFHKYLKKKKKVFPQMVPDKNKMVCVHCVSGSPVTVSTICGGQFFSLI